LEQPGLQGERPHHDSGQQLGTRERVDLNGIGLINDVDDGYWGADFGIPEPGSLVLIGSSLAILGGFLSRKINVKSLLQRN
jgi:hypothetical protein